MVEKEYKPMQLGGRNFAKKICGFHRTQLHYYNSQEYKTYQSVSVKWRRCKDFSCLWADSGHDGTKHWSHIWLSHQPSRHSRINHWAEDRNHLGTPLCCCPMCGGHCWSWHLKGMISFLNEIIASFEKPIESVHLEI